MSHIPSLVDTSVNEDVRVGVDVIAVSAFSPSNAQAFVSRESPVEVTHHDPENKTREDFMPFLHRAPRGVVPAEGRAA